MLIGPKQQFQGLFGHRLQMCLQQSQGLVIHNNTRACVCSQDNYRQQISVVSSLDQCATAPGTICTSVHTVSGTVRSTIMYIITTVPGHEYTVK